MATHWLDRVTSSFAPIWTLKRRRARVAGDLLARHYDAASIGRRTQGWRKSGGDANAIIGPALTLLREHARELVRNNAYAESALNTIADHVVGWGIVAKPTPMSAKTLDVWTRWAETTACDADGRHDFYGLQKLVQRTVVESGEILIRRRWRRPEDGLPLPVQLQILDPDFLDTSRDTAMGLPSSGGKQIIQGVQFDALGRREGYWLFRDHPGSSFGSVQSVFIPASEILHVFKASRPGQVRGPSWFAPVLLRFKDFDEFEDATLMKQKIAACLAIITTDPDGTMPALGTADDTKTPPLDELGPGAIINAPPGRAIEVVQPPRVDEYKAYAESNLRAIATGLGVTYEDLTGDYSDLNFSAARMSRLRHWTRIEDLRWRTLIPQFCDPAWTWAMEAAGVMNLVPTPLPRAVWTAPPAPMIDPVNEGLAYQRNVRSGLQSLSDALRERGYDPRSVFEEMAADNALLDEFGLVLDSDPRRMTQAGQQQGAATPAPPAVDDEDMDRARARARSDWRRR